MKLKSSTYDQMARFIQAEHRRVIVYGAGMIGQIVVPFIATKYGIAEFIDFYVDRDICKIGEHIEIGNRAIEIKSPDVLDEITDDVVILLTNSKFFPVIDFLDKKESLRNSECFIIPVMQKELCDADADFSSADCDSFGVPTAEGGCIDLAGQQPLIPKVIHYCWFGQKEIPDFLKRCMDSWAEKCPDYEIKRWDENNFDVSKYLFTKQAYEKGKYGFVSDVARLDILYRHGGIYMDTDVRLLKSLDGLLFKKGFVGTERWGNVNSGGGIGAVAGHPMIKEMLDYRAGFSFVHDDGTLNIETNGLYETIPFLKRGYRVDNTLQIINDMTVYPASVFHPYDYMSCEERIAENTVSIHYFYGGWMDDADRKNRSDTQDKYKAVLKRMG